MSLKSPNDNNNTTKNEFHNNLNEILKIGQDVSSKYFQLKHANDNKNKSISYTDFITNLERLILNSVSKNIIDKRFKGVTIDIGRRTLEGLCLDFKNMILRPQFHDFLNNIQEKTNLNMTCRHIDQHSGVIIIDWTHMVKWGDFVKQFSYHKYIRSLDWNMNVVL